jgi:hypothetical protein
MSDNLTFFAGHKALAVVKEEGIQPERLRVIAGAAGGPKWLVLNYLDRVIFSQWLQPGENPLFLIGSSIGAWRFAAVSTEQPVESIENFQHAYIHQSYKSKPTPVQVSQTSSKVLNTYLDEPKTAEVLNHPYFHLNVMTVRSKWPVKTDKKALLALGLAAAFIANFVSRSLLKYFFERVLFYDPRHLPPFFNMDQFPIKKIPLSKNNIKQALLASGSIPLVMSAMKNIPGAAQGMYRDGGLLDYHPDMPFTKDDGIVLFPHYADRIIPGWMDKHLAWRKPSRINMDNVVLVCPSKKFIEQLPYKKIPDRNDFYLFKGRQNERISYWNSVVKHSRLLGEEFLDVVQTDKIREVIKPMKHVNN